MNVSLYSKIIFILEKQWRKLIKKNNLRENKNHKADKEAYKACLEQDKLRKAKKQLNEKKTGLTSKRQHSIRSN